MTILYILIILLIVVIILLALSLYVFAKKSIYLSNKEKEFIVFVMDIFENYGSELGVQSKEQHQKLVAELKKIKIRKFGHE